MTKNEKEVSITLTVSDRFADLFEEFTEMCGYPRKAAYRFAFEDYAEEVWYVYPL